MLKDFEQDEPSDQTFFKSNPFQNLGAAAALVNVATAVLLQCNPGAGKTFISMFILLSLVAAG